MATRARCTTSNTSASRQPARTTMLEQPKMPRIPLCSQTQAQQLGRWSVETANWTHALATHSTAGPVRLIYALCATNSSWTVGAISSQPDCRANPGNCSSSDKDSKGNTGACCTRVVLTRQQARLAAGNGKSSAFTALPVLSSALQLAPLLLSEFQLERPEAGAGQQQYSIDRREGVCEPASSDGSESGSATQVPVASFSRQGCCSGVVCFSAAVGVSALQLTQARIASTTSCRTGNTQAKRGQR